MLDALSSYTHINLVSSALAFQNAVTSVSSSYPAVNFKRTWSNVTFHLCQTTPFTEIMTGPVMPNIVDESALRWLEIVSSTYLDGSS